MGIVVDGCEMTLMALFLIPIKKFYNLSNFQLQLISSILFIGFALGCYLNGYVLSKFRRRQIIINSYIAVFIFHTILSFVPNIIFFSISRFFIGFFLGLIIPISLNSLGEFLPIKNRAFILTSIWSFFSIGQGCNAIFMLIGMPNFEIDNMKYVIFSLNILIIVAFVLNDNFYIESPRYLLFKNENDDAFNFLNQMLIQINEEKLSDEEKDNIINENNKHKDNELKQENEYMILFSKKYFQTTILSIGITFILSFLFYGILLISTLTMKQFNSINNPIINNNSISLNNNNTKNENINNTNHNIIKNLGNEDLNNSYNYKKILLSQIISAFISMFGCLIGHRDILHSVLVYNSRLRYHFS
jgi:MFS family permease